MTTVTIPTDYNPFVVKVNNVEYFYKAGDTVEVPDEVAEVISRFEEAKVPEPEKLEYVEGFSYDPVADAGKVLQVRDDGRGIEWGEGSGGGGDEITVESLTVTKNDTYTAEEGYAYSPVVVNVPELSEFDKFIGANGSAEITLNITAPSQDLTITYVTLASAYFYGGVGCDMGMGKEIDLGSYTAETEWIIPVSDVARIIEITILAVDNTTQESNTYFADLSTAVVTGDLEIVIDPDSGDPYISVSGDGTITINILS